jgi:hypothetical protein
MEERLERVPFPRPVHVSIPHDERPHRFVAGNLSAGGMFVRGEPRPPAGTPLQVSLEAKGKVFPFAEAEVVWNADPETWSKEGRTPGFGLRFTRFLHPHSQLLIDHILGRHRPALPPEVGEQLVGEVELPAPVGPPPGFMQQPLEELTPRQFGVPITPRPPGAPPLEVALEPPRDGWVRAGVAVALVALLAAVAAAGVHYARRDTASLAAARGQKVIAAPARPGAPAAPVAEALRETVEPPVKAEAPVAPVPAPARVVAPEPEPVLVEPLVAARSPAPAPPPPGKAGPQHAAPSSPLARVGLPSGGATAVSWREVSGVLEVTVALADGAEVERAFALSAPARLVIDLASVPPAGSVRTESADARVAAVRVGAREGGTRLVLDLASPAGKVEREGHVVRAALVR